MKDSQRIFISRSVPKRSWTGPWSQGMRASRNTVLARHDISNMAISDCLHMIIHIQTGQEKAKNTSSTYHFHPFSSSFPDWLLPPCQLPLGSGKDLDSVGIHKSDAVGVCRVAAPFIPRPGELLMSDIYTFANDFFKMWWTAESRTKKNTTSYPENGWKKLVLWIMIHDGIWLMMFIFYGTRTIIQGWFQWHHILSMRLSTDGCLG